jgi:hypothetical protein
MNAPLIRRPLPQPVKHRITLEEFQQAWDGGVFPDYPPMELFDGDLYEMADDGFRTIDWNAAINRWLIERLSRAYVVIPDKTLRLMEHFAPKPDFYVYDACLKISQVNGQNVLLAIEISDTTVDFDRKVKTPAYEKGGVREHWRIECEARRVMVYRLRKDGTYGEPREVGFEDEIEALLIPGLTLRLSGLDLA